MNIFKEIVQLHPFAIEPSDYEGTRTCYAMLWLQYTLFPAILLPYFTVHSCASRRFLGFMFDLISCTWVQSLIAEVKVPISVLAAPVDHAEIAESILSGRKDVCNPNYS